MGISCPTARSASVLPDVSTNRKSDHGEKTAQPRHPAEKSLSNICVGLAFRLSTNSNVQDELPPLWNLSRSATNTRFPATATPEASPCISLFSALALLKNKCYR